METHRGPDSVVFGRELEISFPVISKLDASSILGNSTC